jgi:hypothetical protein
MKFDANHCGAFGELRKDAMAALTSPAMTIVTSAVRIDGGSALPPAPWELPCDACEPRAPCAYHKHALAEQQ